MSAVPLLLQYAHTPTASPLHSTHSTPPPTPPVHQPPLLSRRYIRDESCHALLPRASYRSLRNSYPLDPVEESRLVGLLTRSGAATAVKPYGACTAAPAVSPSPAAAPAAPPTARTSVAPLLPPSGAPHPPPPLPPAGSLHVSTSPSGQAPTATFSKGAPALGLTSPSSLKLFHPGKSLKKSQSQLIMPSLLTFLRPHTRGDNRTSASRGKKETSKGLARDTSVHSLSSYGGPSSPEPIIRKCHTVIALSSTAGQGVPQATHTRLLKEGKPSGKMSFFKRMSSSKSAIFSSNRGATTINKSPSAVSDLRRLRKNSSLMFGGGDAGVGESTAGCSRCASTASLASARFSSGLAMDSVFCKLCLTDVSVKEIYQLQCLCRFCKYCMTMYTTLKIREGDYTIECPDSNCDCNGELTLEEVESLVGRELLELHLKFRVNREVDLDPLRTWCPTPSCETVVQLTSSKLEGPQCATCSTCSTVFCASCSEPWHPGQSCHAAALMAEGAPLPNNDLIKRCPSCKVPIERDAGCAQMLCKKCKHVFCWYCLASLDDDFLLRHYDKGPCKNKLGHSRASVIWHRAQVIGIFAGFGLLLMVASPLLLFVGPCLLCCKCKPCAKAEVEEESLYGI